MVTNQIMKRDDDRFIQRTKDGYFNATYLLERWNETQPYKKILHLNNYKKNKSTKDFIEQLKEEGIESPMIINKGRNGGTWVHQKIIIDFAMWIDVKFKSLVIDYVLDGLITSRTDAGDYYNQMCATILETHVDYYGCKPNPKLYKEEATRLKELIGVDGKDRNEMTEKELRSITNMQKLNSLLLKDKIGKTARVNQLKLQVRLELI